MLYLPRVSCFGRSIHILNLIYICLWLLRPPDPFVGQSSFSTGHTRIIAPGRQGDPMRHGSSHSLGDAFGIPSGSPRPIMPALLLATGCFLCFYYINTASRLAAGQEGMHEILYAPAALRSAPPSGPRLLPGQFRMLSAQLERMKEELKMNLDEIPRSLFPTTIETPFLGTIQDTHTVVDESCPRYVMMGRPQHGLGHQMGTFTTALITALYFNLTLVDSGFRDDSWHGTYPGIGKFTGLSFGEHQLSDVEPKVKRVIDVDSMPVEPFSHDLKTLYEPLRKTFMEDHKDECNVLFRLREYYSYDYGTSSKWILARKFQDAPEREPLALRYEADRFILALHIRVGDISPTPESFFLRVLSQLMPYVASAKVPYAIHVFANGKGAADFRDLAKEYEGVITFHGELSPFESFYHLTQPHVLVMSASGFSQFSALAGTKALQFSPPSREPFPLAFCPPAAVCCQADGSCGTEGALRIQERLHKYSRAQELEKDITELRQLLGAVGMDEQALQEA